MPTAARAWAAVRSRRSPRRHSPCSSKAAILQVAAEASHGKVVRVLRRLGNTRWRFWYRRCGIVRRRLGKNHVLFASWLGRCLPARRTRTPQPLNDRTFVAASETRQASTWFVFLARHACSPCPAGGIHASSSCFFELADRRFHRCVERHRPREGGWSPCRAGADAFAARQHGLR